MRPRLTALAIVLVVLSGCAEETVVQEPDAFSVRLLTSAAVTGRWERAAEQGLGRIAAELEAEVRRIRCRQQNRPLAALDHEEGVDVVFCVGAGFDLDILARAPDLAETRFVVVPGDRGADNVFGVRFRTEGAGYLGGVVAAALADASAVGVIRGPGGTWLETVEDGFVDGYLAEHSRAEVIEAEGAEAPWDLARRGARVALYASDREDPAVLSAAHDAGILIVAVDPDLLDAEPYVVIAAIKIDVPEAMIRVASALRGGDDVENVFDFDLQSGVVSLELSPTSQAVADPEFREVLESARTAVISGVIEIENLGI